MNCTTVAVSWGYEDKHVRDPLTPAESVMLLARRVGTNLGTAVGEWRHNPAGNPSGPKALNTQWNAPPNPLRP